MTRQFYRPRHASYESLKRPFLGFNHCVKSSASPVVDSSPTKTTASNVSRLGYHCAVDRCDSLDVINSNVNFPTKQEQFKEARNSQIPNKIATVCEDPAGLIEQVALKDSTPQSQQPVVKSPAKQRPWSANQAGQAGRFANPRLPTAWGCAPPEEDAHRSPNVDRLHHIQPNACMLKLDRTAFQAASASLEERQEYAPNDHDPGWRQRPANHRRPSSAQPAPRAPAGVTAWSRASPALAWAAGSRPSLPDGGDAEGEPAVVAAALRQMRRQAAGRGVQVAGPRAPDALPPPLVRFPFRIADCADPARIALMAAGGDDGPRQSTAKIFDQNLTGNI